MNSPQAIHIHVLKLEVKARQASDQQHHKSTTFVEFRYFDVSEASANCKIFKADREENNNVRLPIIKHSVKENGRYEMKS